MMIDRLEPRQLYASISGTLFTDANTSQTYDKGESAMVGATVFIDANKNGAMDSGEQTTTTDSTGRYVFDGVDKGAYTIGTTQDPTQMLSTSAGTTGTVQGRYNITLTGLDKIAPSFRSIFMDAAKRWEEVITGALPADTLKGGTQTTGVQIAISIPQIDGVGMIEGDSNFTQQRKGSYLPSAGFIQLDEADVVALRQDGHLLPVIEHEMAHVMGFGTIWDQLGLVTGNPNRNPRYVGENAIKAYNSEFGETNLSVPVENSGYEGTAGAHWRESVLTNEIMTGYDDGEGVDLPLSSVTVGEFADEGYDVNTAAADKWDPSTEAVTFTTPTDLGAVANERTISVGTHDHMKTLDFGYVAAMPPVIGAMAVTPSPVAVGQDVVISAGKITDTNGALIDRVRFYRDSNGVAGLQPGSDTFLGTKYKAKNGVYSLETSTAGLSGDTTYYALATDTVGFTGRKSQTVNVENVVTPVDAPQHVAVRQRNSSTEHLSFTDDSADVDFYHVQLATTSSFADTSLVQSFNISTSDGLFTNLKDLSAGVRYYVRVRGQNTAGASPYSDATTFEII